MPLLQLPISLRLYPPRLIFCMRPTMELLLLRLPLQSRTSVRMVFANLLVIGTYRCAGKVLTVLLL